MLKQLKEDKILFIVRTTITDHLQACVEAIWDAGGKFVEIALNSPGALEALGRLSGRVPASCFLGAGTCLSPDDVFAAKEAGVSFMVSPVSTPELIAAAQECSLMCIAGAYTPTEISQAHRLGADVIKVFPAESPERIRRITGPLDSVSLMAVGGVGHANVRDFLDAGCCCVGIGNRAMEIEPDGAFRTETLTRAVKRIYSHVR